MTQQVINTGAVANDGTGESLRNAFDAVNNNFANIWTAGPVDSQVVISNNRISTTVQNLPLVLAGNGVGTITVDSTVVPGIDSVYDLGTANSRFNSVYSRYFYGNGAFLSGISNGSGSATSVTFAATPPLAANIGDIWIQSDTGIQYLYFNDNTSNQWAEMEAYQSFSSGGTGNGNVDLTSVSSDIIPSTNNSYSLGSSGYQWKDLWVSNSTIYLNSLPITADGANLKVNGNTVLTTSSPLSFSNLSVTGNVSANAVYTNNYFYANGAPFPQGSNSLPGTTISLKDNVIATTTLNQNLVLSANGVGNVQTNSSIMPDATQVRDIGSASNKFNSIYAGYYYGNGSQLTGISAGNSNSIISGNSNVKIVSAGGNVTIGIGGIGNIVVVSGAGEYVTGVVSASGNITAPYFVGNGSLLTGITTVAAANTAQTVTANAQANITSVGTLTSLSVTGTVQGGNILTSGIVSTTGNITGNFFIGNGSQLTGLPATYGNSNVVANLAALGSNPVSTTGNVTGGNLVTGAQVVASGVIQTGTGFSTGGYLSVDGDTDLHKTTVTGNLSATGNITANVSSFFIGNGSQLTGIVSSYGNANVVANLALLGSNPVSTTGNITSGNISTGTITTTGNITFAGDSSSAPTLNNFNVNAVSITATAGNLSVINGGAANLSGGYLSVARDISATGNITGNFFIGNGSQLTGITAASSYGNANVVANLAALGSNPVSTTGNVSAGYLFGNGSQLSGLPATYGNANVVANLAALGSNPVSTTGNVTAGNLNSPTLNNSGNISVVASGNTWTFGTNGTTTFPTNISINYSAGNVQFPRIIADSGKAFSIQAQGNTGSAALAWTVDPDAASQYAQVGVTRGGGDNLAKVVLQAQSDSGNVATAKTWQFNESGNLALPRGGVVYETSIPGGGLTGNTIALKPQGGTNGDQQLLVYPTAGPVTDANHLHLTSGNLYNTELFLGDDNLFVKLANTGNVVINSNDGTGNSAQWTFGANGNLTVPGGIVGSGASPAPYLSGFSSVSAITVSASGNISATGNVTGGNVLIGGVISSTGNITGGNISATNHTGTTVSVTGNITAVNFFGNGNTLSNVATRFESSWTVPVGNSTQSFTVGANETYYLWVDCNIPNGILAWNATATVTNTNVPVVGAQYAWVYSGGGTPIDFTSIPNQFIGTANAIVRSSTAPSATTNRFDFGINNTSGNSQTVRYGWVAIS